MPFYSYWDSPVALQLDESTVKDYNSAVDKITEANEEFYSRHGRFWRFDKDVPLRYNLTMDEELAYEGMIDALWNAEVEQKGRRLTPEDDYLYERGPLLPVGGIDIKLPKLIDVVDTVPAPAVGKVFDRILGSAAFIGVVLAIVREEVF